jgi:S-adenosylmethionine:tRNA ribosyltransferase-isomerase
VVAPHGMRDLTVADLPGELRKGDVLVFNNTRVIPAALSGHRVGRLGTTPKIEALLHQRLDGRAWKAFVKPAKKLIAGDRLRFGALSCSGRCGEGRGRRGDACLRRVGCGTGRGAGRGGRVPLPPYIESQRAQDAQDRADYQTVYARMTAPWPHPRPDCTSRKA